MNLSAQFNDCNFKTRLYTDLGIPKLQQNLHRQDPYLPTINSP